MSLLPGKLLLVQQPINKRERQEGAFYVERNADDDKLIRLRKNKSSLGELSLEMALPFKRKNALLNQQCLVVVWGWGMWGENLLWFSKY